MSTILHIWENRTHIASEEVTFALIKSKCLPTLLYDTEACPINSAMRLSLQLALIRALLKIFGALCKDTYKDICKYFGIKPMDEQISARQSKFNLRYCASESIDVQKRFYVFFYFGHGFLRF